MCVCVSVFAYIEHMVYFLKYVNFIEYAKLSCKI